MKKVSVAILVLTLSLLMATFANAQQNKLAFFDIDANIGAAGFQGGRIVEGIGGNARVGFAIYVKNVDQLRAISLDVTWNGAQAARVAESGYGIDIDDRVINGGSITLKENNVMGDVSGIVVADVTGRYAVDFATLGGTAVATTDYGLVYCFVLRTVDTFKTSDSMTVNVKVKALNDSGVSKDLGSRDFYVNGAVDVKTSTWGEIKSQFKD